MRILIGVGKIRCKGDSLRMLAEEQVVRNIEIPASRGSIWSRDGKFLSTNMPVYKVYVDLASEELYTPASRNSLPDLRKLLPLNALPLNGTPF